MSNDMRREALARQIAERMHRSPDEQFTLPSGETMPLWKIVDRAMNAIPAPLRTLMDNQGRRKRDTPRAWLARMLRRLRRFDGWHDPRDRLPELSDNGVLSELVLVKHMDKIKPAVLLYGTPVGSHRWIIDKDKPTEHYIHLLDIDGWQEMGK